MDYSLSAGDIQKYLRNTKIISYGEIQRYRTAADLVYPYNECVILYKTADNYGHWTGLIKNKHGYEFFDPYGVMLDDELDYPVEFSPEKFKNEEEFKWRNGQDYRYLTKLLSEVPQTVSYNHHKFQKFKRPDGVRPATCGRHTIFRLLNKSKSLEQYKKEFDELLQSNNIEDYDEAVVQMVRI